MDIHSQPQNYFFHENRGKEGNSCEDFFLAFSRRFQDWQLSACSPLVRISWNYVDQLENFSTMDGVCEVFFRGTIQPNRHTYNTSSEFYEYFEYQDSMASSMELQPARKFLFGKIQKCKSSRRAMCQRAGTRSRWSGDRGIISRVQYQRSQPHHF